MRDPFLAPGRELCPLEPAAGEWRAVVALLNVWNDLPELEANLPKWLPYVDHVIAADGAYRGVRAPCSASTDGTLEFLRQCPKVHIIEAPSKFWPDQCVKRSAMFGAFDFSGAVLWRIDADEAVENPEVLRDLPSFDVGWATYTSPVYTRAQNIPVLFRYRPGLEIRTRHHWTHLGDRLVSTHQLGGSGFDHRLTALRFHNGRGSRRPGERTSVAMAHRRTQVREEKSRSPELRTAGVEPLRIVQVGAIDPGFVAYRLHSAINTTTPHLSAFIKRSEEPPHRPPFQHLTTSPSALDPFRKADVLHLHAGYMTLSEMIRTAGSPRAKWIVSHHHGTGYRRRPEVLNRHDRTHRALRLVSNLELLQYGDGLQYLPNPVPFARYAALAAEKLEPVGLVTSRKIRVAHSPTKEANKGTELLRASISRLRRRKVPVELVMIHGREHGEALRLKASCDITFDSFWLGLQCSGLEAAAMGQAVIAGDEDIRTIYEEWLGECPYTFAADPAELDRVLERLVVDPEWRASEAERVARYVLDFHDYPAVANRYLELLDTAFGWRQALGL